MTKNSNWLKTKTLATEEEIYGNCKNTTCETNQTYYFTDNTAICIYVDKVIYYKLINPYTIDIPLVNYIKKIHRNDGPAIEYIDGDKTWYEDGKIHRNDGPAIEYSNGGTKWYINDKLHREDGPAIEYVNGDKEYYINGKLHREDGPAYIHENIKQWYINGKLHREDGPAEVYRSGLKMWYINGQLHRNDGPAIEYPNGGTKWYMEGKHIKFVWLKKIFKVL